MCFSAVQLVSGSFQVHYPVGKDFEIFHENCRKITPLPNRPTKRKIFSFVLLGRKEMENENIVRTKPAWLKRYITAVGLFSVLAVIMNRLLREEWLMQKKWSKLNSDIFFTFCYYNTEFTPDRERSRRMTIRVKHELSRKYVTLTWIVIILRHASHPDLGFCTVLYSLSLCSIGSKWIITIPGSHLALEEDWRSWALCVCFVKIVTLLDFFYSEIII